MNQNIEFCFYAENFGFTDVYLWFVAWCIGEHYRPSVVLCTATLFWFCFHTGVQVPTTVYHETVLGFWLSIFLFSHVDEKVYIFNFQNIIISYSILLFFDCLQFLLTVFSTIKLSRYLIIFE